MTSTNTSTNNGKRPFPWAFLIAVGVIVALVVGLIIWAVLTFSSGSKTARASASRAPATTASPSPSSSRLDSLFPSPSPEAEEDSSNMVLYTDLQKELGLRNGWELFENPLVSINERGWVLYDEKMVMKDDNILVTVFFSELQKEYDLDDMSELFLETKVPKDKIKIDADWYYWIFYDGKVVMNDETKLPVPFYWIDENNNLVVLTNVIAGNKVTTRELEVLEETVLNGDTTMNGGNIKIEGDYVEISSKGEMDITANGDIKLESTTGDVTISAPKGDVNIKAGDEINLKAPDIKLEGNIWNNGCIWDTPPCNSGGTTGGGTTGGGITGGGNTDNDWSQDDTSDDDNDWSQDDDSWGDGGSSGGGNNNGKTYNVISGYGDANKSCHLVLIVRNIDPSCTVKLDGVTHNVYSDIFQYNWDVPPGYVESSYIVYDGNGNPIDDGAYSDIAIAD